MRVVGRRVVVLGVVCAQLAFIAAGYSSDHKTFAFQMFPEASTWQADVVRVTPDGRRVPVSKPWAGYHWDSWCRTARGRTPRAAITPTPGSPTSLRSSDQPSTT